MNWTSCLTSPISFIPPSSLFSAQFSFLPRTICPLRPGCCSRNSPGQDPRLQLHGSRQKMSTPFLSVWWTIIRISPRYLHVLANPPFQPPSPPIPSHSIRSSSSINPLYSSSAISSCSPPSHHLIPLPVPLSRPSSPYLPPPIPTSSLPLFLFLTLIPFLSSSFSFHSPVFLLPIFHFYSSFS